MEKFDVMTENIFNEVNEVSPTVIDHFVGQEQVVNRIKVALEASWNDNHKLPHMLFAGPAGLGKSQLASIVSKEMGCDLHEQLAQNLCSPSDLNAFLLEPKDKEVVLIDEIHELPTMVQTTLYRAMENRQIFLDSNKTNKTRPLRISNFTIIGATTDPHYLLKPLRDRFKLVLNFDFYNPDELELLVKQRCRQLNWQVEDEVHTHTAKLGRGTPRISLRLLESVRRYARSVNSDVITMEHFEKTCKLEGLDEYGLGIEERKYLSFLKDNNGTARLNVLATRLGLSPRTVREMIESHLVRIGLIIIQPNSQRLLTPDGIEHIQSNPI